LVEEWLREDAGMMTWSRAKTEKTQKRIGHKGEINEHIPYIPVRTSRISTPGATTDLEFIEKPFPFHKYLPLMFKRAMRVLINFQR
jgi:hypothetical protein